MDVEDFLFNVAANKVIRVINTQSKHFLSMYYFIVKFQNMPLNDFKSNPLDKNFNGR